MERLIVVDPSHTQQAFSEVIRNIPVQPECAELWFRADGIKEPPLSLDEDAEKHFLDLCQGHHVLPNSRVLFKYDYYSDKGWIRRTKELGLGASSLDKIDDLNLIAQGGRFYRLGFEVPAAAYKKFINSDFFTVNEAGYQISSADLWISSYRSTGYNSGTYKDSGITCNLGGSGGEIRLELTKFLPNKTRIDMEEWFDIVAQAFSVPIIDPAAC